MIITKLNKKPLLVDKVPTSLNDPMYDEILSSQARNSDKLHLDIGAGTGANAKYASSFGLKTISLEYDQDYVSRIQFGEPINGSALNLPFNANTFDLITLMHVLEHLPEYQIALDEIRRVIKMDGYLVIEVPNKYSLQELFNYLYTRIVLDNSSKHLGHCNYFSYKRLEIFLIDSGFVVINSNVIGGLFCGSIKAIIRLFFAIILKGIFHRHKQDIKDNERIDQLLKNFNPLFIILTKIDTHINKKTNMIGESMGFVCKVIWNSRVG